jgi:hypothetical protein
MEYSVKTQRTHYGVVRSRGKRQEKDFLAFSPQPVYKKGSAFFFYSILVTLIGDSWLDASDR